MGIAIKRVYEAPAEGDGYRVLIDRLWPRGLKKEAVPMDVWAKELAPSTELRKWFGHDPALWDEFRQRYAAELAESADVWQALARRSAKEPVTLLYGARDEEHNDAVALKALMEQWLRRHQPR
ncbi:hypothetical protein UU9_14545 [Rhodanobacter fulvus Jip2]|jgi:uncharacterized protein YeaO (DUF488 family)|uniref:Uroporphyrin-III C-methyltransferase n=1 Tax=Rhodanobacter fulvus Jip2 TaxID=1163408 RepID=I4VLE3_9GAMM|nr:DUF488 domain-containing protein [Rhodanobacter fulvus]EIL88034.1 hypothetical protein UU9_14545 [Rhodanobacter fulvus Jip2]